MVENMGKSIRDKYPKELGLKVEHQCDHAMFLNSNITIKERNPINKLIDKTLPPLLNCKNASYRTQYPSKKFLFTTKGQF